MRKLQRVALSPQLRVPIRLSRLIWHKRFLGIWPFSFRDFGLTLSCKFMLPLWPQSTPKPRDFKVVQIWSKRRLEGVPDNSSSLGQNNTMLRMSDLLGTYFSRNFSKPTDLLTFDPTYNVFTACCVINSRPLLLCNSLQYRPNTALQANFWHLSRLTEFGVQLLYYQLHRLN